MKLQRKWIKIVLYFTYNSLKHDTIITTKQNTLDIQISKEIDLSRILRLKKRIYKKYQISMAPLYLQFIKL